MLGDLSIQGSLRGSDGKVCLQSGRVGFHPWVGRIPWRREWQPTPVFLLGEFHGQRRLDKRVTPSFLLRNGPSFAFRVVYRVTGHLSKCLWDLRVFLDDARGCQCPFVLCLHPQVFLQRGVLASGSFQEWTVKLGSFGMWHHPRV